MSSALLQFLCSLQIFAKLTSFGKRLNHRLSAAVRAVCTLALGASIYFPSLPSAAFSIWSAKGIASDAPNAFISEALRCAAN